MFVIFSLLKMKEAQRKKSNTSQRQNPFESRCSERTREQRDEISQRQLFNGLKCKEISTHATRYSTKIGLTHALVN